MLSRVACAFSRRRFRQQQVLRGGSREEVTRRLPHLAALDELHNSANIFVGMRQVRRVPGVRESETLCPIDSTCELAHDLREPWRALTTVRRAGEEKLESLLRSRSAYLASCSSSRKVGALFINVWRISSGSCSHIPGPSAISSTNRLVPPTMSPARS